MLLRRVLQAGSALLHSPPPTSTSCRCLSAMAPPAKVIYMAKKFAGEPKPSDFQIKEEPLPDLKEGEILVEAEWMSVDPYMRAYMDRYPAGTKMIGGQVGKVLQSKHKEYKVGDAVVGYLGWSSRSVVHVDSTKGDMTRGDVEKVRHSDMPLSYALGALGMPGATAYFGLLELCQPKEGETVVVNGAAGAVGMLVGQIAKVKGCKVIGFAGSDAKVEWLKKTLGFDFAYNYKTCNIANALKESAPNGVDCYFDNVGGEFSSIVLSKMNLFGRIAVCGAIASYNADMANPPQAPVIQGSMVFKQLKMEGFVVSRWRSRFPEAYDQMHKWIKEGKLKVQEHVYEGFENMPNALIGMLRGENTGKAVVKVSKL
ncbi:prostaglandin reductase 1 [Frankliniella occidentalis]|uniref:Prostaglandin reductase 1 n=1 Tax=Frankliniella occidentalis TaxID=133901 RepID=A0A6J1SDH7_FRAOC|nr:prostaglandin reductase 1 [Frankliniella occidentalis]